MEVVEVGDLDTSKPYEQVRRLLALDSAFAKVVLDIEKRLKLFSRVLQVRIKLWIRKLKENTNNVVWKKNRNAYARLLLEQLRNGELDAPFDLSPPEGPLRTLPKWMTYRHMSPSRRRSPVSRQEEQANARTEDYGGSPRRSQGSRCSSPRSPRRLVDPNPLQAIRSSRMTSPSYWHVERKVAHSRDCISDLEWRLKKAEDKITFQNRAKSHQRRKKNRACSRAELEGIIQQFEKRRDAWKTVDTDAHYETCPISQFTDFSIPAEKCSETSRELQYALSQFEKRTKALKSWLDSDHEDTHKQAHNHIHTPTRWSEPAACPSSRDNGPVKCTIKLSEISERGHGFDCDDAEIGALHERRKSVTFDALSELASESLAAAATAALEASEDGRGDSRQFDVNQEAVSSRVGISRCGDGESASGDDAELVAALRSFKMKTDDLKEKFTLSMLNDGAGRM